VILGAVEVVAAIEKILFPANCWWLATLKALENASPDCPLEVDEASAPKVKVVPETVKQRTLSDDPVVRA
jgi:hypothetical protein